MVLDTTILQSSASFFVFHSANCRCPLLLLAQGFGGGGFGSANPRSKQPTKKVSKKSILKKVEKKYGGTSSQDIARGTQKEIEKAMSALPQHLQLAAQLYQKIQQWDARMENLSVLQQAQIPQQELDGAKRAREELERIYSEHDITENDIHNVFQKVTWDASADAKAARALTGDMPKDTAERVQKACDIAAEAVERAGDIGRCLDVGCGFGVLVPFLKKSGISAAQIHGVDLSPEMIRNARDQYPDVHNFEACDFLSYNGADEGFDAILFCTSLHDMPDMEAVLRKAASMLRLNGKLVIVHPQGASHVLNQSRSNPILVKRGLPTTDDFNRFNLGLQLTLEPASPNSPEESRCGYLAVLERT